MSKNCSICSMCFLRVGDTDFLNLGICCWSRLRYDIIRRACPGRVTARGSGRVGSGRVGSGRVGSGRVGSGRVGSGRQS